ncbi:MAG: polysaccharide lyase 8 family protein [Candidatus Sumerlaeota bacterium]|nr:polysaccharide lyase 8 family protein [Candidatus Sumerlaeota bacterium]
MRLVTSWFLCISISWAADVGKKAQETVIPIPNGGFEMENDLKTIKERVVAPLMKGSAKPEEIKKLMGSLAADGHWPDINYHDTHRAAWQTDQHVSRILAMAKAWKLQASPLKGDAALKAALDKALAYWNANDFQCPNWYQNKITVPRLLGQTLLVLEGDLSQELWDGALQIIRHGQLGMTGANLTWLAQVNIMRACLENNPGLAMECFQRVADEIRISPADGIQADFSFYQHGRQFYSGGYGIGFANDIPGFVALARDTGFQLPKDKLEIHARYLLDGEQWMIWKGLFDYSACGRGITRKSGGGDSGAKMANSCESMAQACPDLQPDLEAAAKRLRGDKDARPLVGNRSYWRCDYMAHRRADFFSSVRMTSNRLLQTEIVNDENQRGQFLSDGVQYVYRTGQEYKGIFPVWDWRRLPGITCEQKPEPPQVSKDKIRFGECSFVGAVSDGMCGMAAMDFARGPLAARKAWFFLDGEIVCLGAGVSCSSDNPVLTSVNQCLMKGPVTVFDGSRAKETPRGEQTLAASSWVFHDGVGYVFPDQSGVHLRADVQKGSWGDINFQYSKDEAALDVFSLWIDHGAQPTDAAYQYVIAPAAALEEMEDYATALPFTVLQNAPALQAIWSQPLGLWQAAFYEPGEIKTPGDLAIAVDKPCLMMARKMDRKLEISVSNPEHQPLEVIVTVNQPLKGEGAEPAGAGATRITFVLPGELYAGQTVTRSFEFGA